MNRLWLGFLAMAMVIGVTAVTPLELRGATAGPPTVGAPLPAGHPPLPGAPHSGTAAMPAGHPPMPGGPPPVAPDAKGSLVVQAVQGTRGGPAIAGDAVVVELIHDGQSVKKIEAKLDDRGQAIMDDLPVGLGVQPEVLVRHAGVEYRQTGEFMHASPPDQRVTVVVYEPSEKAPQWIIKARHLFVKRIDEGFYVKDMMVVESPTDRAWVGRADAKGLRTTLELQLAKNTGRVDFYAGFDRLGTELIEGKLVNRTPLLPGTSQYQFGYIVPITDGQAVINVYNPADTGQLVVIMPDDGSKATVTGLSEGEAAEMGPQKVRIFSAQDVKAGQGIGVTLSGLAETAPASPAPLRPKAAANAFPQTMALVGGGVVLAGGLALVCLKRPRVSPRNA
jgi:hypothetical protein